MRKTSVPFLFAAAVSAVAISCAPTPPPEPQIAPAAPQSAPVAEPVPAEIAVPAPERGEPASVLVLVSDLSGKKLFGNAAAPIRESVAAELAALGVNVRSPDFLQNPDGGNEIDFGTLSPADAATLAGTDFVLTIRLATPIDFTSGGTNYTRQNISYSLVSATGAVIDSGKSAKIFSAREILPAHREMLAADAAEALAGTLAAKISDGKLVLRKPAVPALVDAEFVCVLEDISFPHLVKNADGEFAIRNIRGNASVAGATLRIAGVDYFLSANGEPTRIAVPQGRPFAVRISHKDLRVEKRVVKVGSAGEKIVFALALNDTARERFQSDLKEISAALKREERAERAEARADKKLDAEIERERVISDATAELIRGKAQFWANSGIHFTQSVSRNISHEEKTVYAENADVLREETADVPAEISGEISENVPAENATENPENVPAENAAENP